MRIEYKEGEWFSGGEPVMFFEVNKTAKICNESMAQLKKHYKDAYFAYKGTLEQAARDGNTVNLGDIVWIAHASGKTLACAIVIDEDDSGQEKVSYEGLVWALAAIDRKCGKNGVHYCSFHEVGKDIIDGNWGIIKELIENNSENYTPVVYIPDPDHCANLISQQLEQIYIETHQIVEEDDGSIH